jgi:hypothetical protein
MSEYTFYTYPWNLWIAGFIIIITSIFLTYLLIIDLDPKERSAIASFLNILFYYISFYLFYVGQIETLIVDRKVNHSFIKRSRKEF